MPQLQIPRQAVRQHLAQIALAVPAAVVTQGQAVELDQLGQHRGEFRFQALDIGLAKAIDLGTGQGQFLIPAACAAGSILPRLSQ